MKPWKIAVALLAVLAIAAVALPGVAQAAPPVNDNFANATVVSSLPFSDSVDTGEATTELNEPQFCNYMPQTVWYAVTPAADGLLSVDPAGSTFTYGAQINLYRADGPDITNLTFLTCQYYGNQVSANVQAGQTYYIQAGPTFGGTGTLHLQVSEHVPPPNDDFDTATVISSLPFSDTVDATLATTAFDDPYVPCQGGQGLNSVWYSFTAGANIPVGFDTIGSDYMNAIAVYTGTRGALTPVGCSWSGDRSNSFGLNAQQGVTYYIEVTANSYFGFGDGLLNFHARQGPTVTGFTINKAASVNNASGVATISGTISCDLDATATISGTLRQKLNRYTVITGSYSITTTCAPGGSAWSAQVIGNNGPFGGGQAGADATGTACLNPNGYGGGTICTSLSASQTVSLRGGH
jgi:hypothetical protein